MTSEIVKKDLWEIINRVNKQKPKAEDVAALKKLLDDNPDLWRRVGNLAHQNIANILQGPGWSAAAREMDRSSIEGMRSDLGYEESPMLEKLLIDQVLLSWLRLQWCEYQYTGLNAGEGVTLIKARFWENRMSAVQRRFLQAGETLARVHKLARRDPALQVNIATQDGQQVNVAGDLVKSG